MHLVAERSHQRHSSSLPEQVCLEGSQCLTACVGLAPTSALLYGNLPTHPNGGEGEEERGSVGEEERGSMGEEERGSVGG